MSFHIGILQLKKELDDTVEGFLAGLKKAGLDSEEIEIDYRNVQENVPSFGQEADDLVASGVDLIFACTTPAAKFAKEATEFYGIPVVFAPVYDPLAAGLVASWQGSGNHLAGVSGKVDVALKLDLLQALRPGLGKVAVPYDPDDPNAPLELADLGKEAEARGIEILPLKVHDPNMLGELPMLEGSQFVYVPICRMIEDNFRPLAEYCYREKLPLCGPNAHTVREGALCCVDSLHYELGVQVGEIAAQILQGRDPGEIPIGRPKKTKVFINQRVAEKVGVETSGLKDVEIINS
ncbi:MAG: ABC transporter substrate-binding protein [Firmicutes bacterium]|nr:ABC transporter substrate-binding protein [Bacillota bacterium]